MNRPCPYCRGGTESHEKGCTHAEVSPIIPVKESAKESPDQPPKEAAPSLPIGWICPRCGKVNSPFKPTCDCFPMDSFAPYSG